MPVEIFFYSKNILIDLLCSTVVRMKKILIYFLINLIIINKQYKKNLTCYLDVFDNKITFVFRYFLKI
jgi:hypothetical protein